MQAFLGIGPSIQFPQIIILKRIIIHQIQGSLLKDGNLIHGRDLGLPPQHFFYFHPIIFIAFGHKLGYSIGMGFEKHKDFLRYEKTARNLFLQRVQSIQSMQDAWKESRIWNRLLYLESHLTGVAGVPDAAVRDLQQAIQAAKGIFGTSTVSAAGGSMVEIIEDSAFEDVVRMVLMILEEMEK